MANAKSKAIEHERRSSKQAATEAGKKLSAKHLKDSIQFNERHDRDHRKLEREEKSKLKHTKSKALKKRLKEDIVYNEDHAKKHEKNAQEDREELKERK